MKQPLLTLGSATILAMVITFAIGRSPAVPAPPLPRPKPIVLTEPMDEPKPVRTIAITREAPRPVPAAATTVMPSAVPQIAALPFDEPEPRVRKRSRHRTSARTLPGRKITELCARHGLRKVTTGRSWRCRR